MGHWEEAFTNLQRAVELDPRTINRSKVFATTCASLRRFPEVNATADRVLSIEPGNSIALEQKLVSYWAIGNLDAAEALLAKPALDPADRGVHALFRRRYGEAVDIFEKALGTVEHDGFVWLSLRLGLAQQRTGDAAAARATYERVRGYLKHELEGPTAETVSEAGNHSSAGVVAAALGEPAAAIAEGKRGLALQPTAEDAFEGPAREEELAQIYSLLGDADHAIPILQRLLKTHYLGSYGAAITPALLRNDPIWDPIRNDLRFQQLEDTTAM